MNKTSITTGKSIKALALALGLAALPLLTGLTGCTTTTPPDQSRGEVANNITVKAPGN